LDDRQRVLRFWNDSGVYGFFLAANSRLLISVRQFAAKFKVF